MSRQRLQQRWRSGWLDRSVVFTEQRRNRGSDLCLGDGCNTVTLAQRRRVRSNDRDPDVLRTVLLDSVFLPVNATVAPA